MFNERIIGEKNFIISLDTFFEKPIYSLRFLNSLLGKTIDDVNVFWENVEKMPPDLRENIAKKMDIYEKKILEKIKLRNTFIRFLRKIGIRNKIFISTALNGNILKKFFEENDLDTFITRIYGREISFIERKRIMEIIRKEKLSIRDTIYIGEEEIEIFTIKPDEIFGESDIEEED